MAQENVYEEVEIVGAQRREEGAEPCERRVELLCGLVDGLDISLGMSSLSRRAEEDAPTC